MKYIAITICCFLIAGALLTCSSSSDSNDTYKRGLTVTYSNGTNTVETIILHGWRAECSDTDNNFYQGECTPLSNSPVDWAWGNNFSATWTGFILIPTSGEYTFSSWVDGTVYIEIADTVIANFNTVGSSYSKTMTFQEAGWKPILMTFTANGGSNSMHIGWVVPGGTYVTVPAKNLGHE